MSKAGRVCLEPGCPEIVTSGNRCRAHAPTRPRNGSTYAWRRTRDRILRRDGYRCSWIDNGERCPNRDDLHVDHVVPLARGGSDDPANLRVLCADHNLRKGTDTDTRNG